MARALDKAQAKGVLAARQSQAARQAMGQVRDQIDSLQKQRHAVKSNPKNDDAQG